MGILQAAHRTYESYSAASGVAQEGKEALLPVAHIVQKAMLEIEIDVDGKFRSAQSLGKGENTIIPVTETSATRTSINAHPLCDQLSYVAQYGGKKFESYIAQLSDWADSEFSHEKVRAVRAYIEGGTIINDLAAAELIKLGENGAPERKHDKDLVRWRVIPSPDGVSSACWLDNTLFESYLRLSTSKQIGVSEDLCMISGVMDIPCESHPKGVVPASNNAKLISQKDDLGYKYKGRFADARQAYNVGYISSQKAHSALRWVSVNHGVTFGDRTFICWNPEGKAVPVDSIYGNLQSESSNNLEDYKRSLALTINGYRNDLSDTDDVIIAALDAATTGRLSVTYYNELKSSDFLERIETWYSSCCWRSHIYGVQSPPIYQIVQCAFGTLQGELIKVEPRVLREHVQRLMHCILDMQPIPADIVKALAAKAGNMQIYKDKNREKILTTACAIIRKYRNDKFKEEWDLSLDKTNTDRSYLFGRLLAIAEHVESSTYEKGEGRETNAIRMQAIFVQRPLYAWQILEQKLKPYYVKLGYGRSEYYKGMMDEIIDMLPADTTALSKKLDEIYLIGHHHQRTALSTKKDTTNTEGN